AFGQHQHECIGSHQRCADLALAVPLPGLHRSGGDVLHLSPRLHRCLLRGHDHDPEKDEHDGAARPESGASPQMRGPVLMWRRGACAAIAGAATMWPVGPIRATRHTGVTGATGTARAAGVTGPTRPAGTARAAGVTGPTRPAGPAGAAGPTGTVAARCGDVELLHVVVAHRPIMRTSPCRLPISRPACPSRRRSRCTPRR